jgi:hypothetical protein
MLNTARLKQHRSLVPSEGKGILILFAVSSAKELAALQDMFLCNSVADNYVNMHQQIPTNCQHI